MKIRWFSCWIIC